MGLMTMALFHVEITMSPFKLQTFEVRQDANKMTRRWRKISKFVEKKPKALVYKRVSNRREYEPM